MPFQSRLLMPLYTIPRHVHQHQAQDLRGQHQHHSAGGSHMEKKDLGGSGIQDPGIHPQPRCRL